MGNPFIRFIRRVGCVVAAAFLCLSMVVTLAAFSLRIALRQDWFITASSTDRFVDTLHAEALDYFQDECLFYGLPFETLKSVVTRGAVQEAATAFFPSVYTDWQTGQDTAKIVFDPLPLKEAIDRYFATLPNGEKPLDTTASSTISGEIAQGLSLVLQAGVGGMVDTIGSAVYAKSGSLYRIASLSLWMAVLTVMFTGIFFLLCQGTIRRRLYYTIGWLFIGASLVAVPVWLLVRYDLPKKIAIGQSALRVFLEEILYGISQHICFLTTVTFVVTFVALIVATILLVKKQKTA